VNQNPFHIKNPPKAFRFVRLLGLNTTFLLDGWFLYIRYTSKICGGEGGV